MSASTGIYAMRPGDSPLVQGGSLQFYADVSDPDDGHLVWSCSGGTIDQTGLFTVPLDAAPGTRYSIDVMWSTVPSAQYQAVVTVVSLVTVHVTPGYCEVSRGSTQQYTAVVTNTDNHAVTWLAAPVGSISVDGLLTVPVGTPVGTHIGISARSVADPTVVFGVYSVVVDSGTVSVVVTPDGVEVARGHSQQFTATVLGTENTAVTWSAALVYGTHGAVPITPGGVLLIPSQVEVGSEIVVTATSIANPSVSGSGRCWSWDDPHPGAVTVTPATADCVQGCYVQLSASVAGHADQSVAWSAGGSSALVDATGLMLVPFGLNSGSTVTVTATSVADPSLTGTCVVTVTPTTSAAEMVKGLFLDGAFRYFINYRIGARGPAPGWRTVSDHVYQSRELSAAALNLPALFVETRMERARRVASGNATQVWVEVTLGMAVAATTPPEARHAASVAADLLTYAGADVLRLKRGLVGGVVDYELREVDPEGDLWASEQGGVECRFVTAVFAASVVWDI